MSMRKVFVPILLAYAIISLACVYIVLPEGYETSGDNNKGSSGWSAVATNIKQSESGDLHIDITIINDTGDWSAMDAVEEKPVSLTNGGKSISCDTVFISTGGHRLAPGFQMRGYTVGTKTEPVTQLIYVECAGAEATPGSILTIPYTYVTGQYNYYEQDKNRVEGSIEINLDEVITYLVYPIAEEIDGLIQQPDIVIVAINKVTLTLNEVLRTESNLQFNWKTYNPGEYPTYVHIGDPPVIGDDGILYGFYQTPDIITVPITPAGGTAEWTTDVSVPPEVKGFYILLSVETGKARLFANYAIDITGE
jgi:hypothetical protein